MADIWAGALSCRLDMFETHDWAPFLIVLFQFLQYWSFAVFGGPYFIANLPKRFKIKNRFNRALRRRSVPYYQNTSTISKFYFTSDRSTESQLSCIIYKLTKASYYTISLSHTCISFLVFAVIVEY